MRNLGLTRRELGAVWGLLLAGLLIRAGFAWGRDEIGFDIESAKIVAAALRDPVVGVYDTTRWPYPGGFLPLIAAADWANRTFGVGFVALYQLPAIVADLALAWLAAMAVHWSGATSRRVLAGAALVALGPSFMVISGYHGQVDSVAALPALAGVLIWMRGGSRRALWTGLLIGLGAAVKQPLGFAALAVLPTARSWRERGIVLALTAAVPLVSLAPFLAESPRPVLDAMGQNNGVAGFGGLSAFAQPSVTRFWATLENPVPPNDAILTMWEAQRWLVAAGVVAATAVAWRRRLPPLHAASLIYLTIFVVNPNFAYQYLIWGLPFFVAAGFLAETALFQAAVFPATALLYWRPAPLEDAGWPYLVAIQTVWIGLVTVLFVVARNLLRAPRQRAAGSVTTRWG